MSKHSVSHLSDDALTHELVTWVANGRTNTAGVLVRLAEYDVRHLFLPAGYSSLHAFCVGRFKFTDDEAYRRIGAARAARRFPVIFDMVADSRLSLSAVCMLSPHLTEDTAHDLLAAAADKTKNEIAEMLARRFPVSDVLPWVTPIPQAPAVCTGGELVPGRVETETPPTAATTVPPGRVAGRVGLPAPTHLVPGRVARVNPLSAQSYAVQFTLSREAHEKLKRVQALLGDSTDLAGVFEKGLDTLLSQLEKRKFGAIDKPRRPRPRKASANPRYVPKHVRRSVWMRDGGRCTFVSDDDHRCEERKHLQLDHVLPVALGGESTVDNLRLRCRGHNQYEAERAFGAEFMRHKRTAAIETSAARQAIRLAAGTP